MFESYAHTLLNAILGGYVKEFDPEALKLSVWNGDIQIDNLELRPQALSQLSQLAPLQVEKGVIGRFTLKVPWKNLLGQPIQVKIDDLYILLHTHNEFTAESTLAEELQQSMQHRLALKRAQLEAQAKTEEFQDQSSAGIATRLLIKVLDNVQLEINRVHVRLEDHGISDRENPFALGIVLDQLIIQSTDKNWNYTLRVRGASDKTLASCLRKRMELQRFGFYWNLSARVSFSRCLLPLVSSIIVFSCVIES